MKFSNPFKKNIAQQKGSTQTVGDLIHAATTEFNSVKFSDEEVEGFLDEIKLKFFIENKTTLLTPYEVEKFQNLHKDRVIKYRYNIKTRKREIVILFLDELNELCHKNGKVEHDAISTIALGKYNPLDGYNFNTLAVEYARLSEQCKKLIINTLT